jgi:hypothetical protein
MTTPFDYMRRNFWLTSVALIGNTIRAASRAHDKDLGRLPVRACARTLLDGWLLFTPSATEVRVFGPPSSYKSGGEGRLRVGTNLSLFLLQI